MTPRMLADGNMTVQKANYAVKMYRKAGFEIVDENDEEYVMLNRLQRNEV